MCFLRAEMKEEYFTPEVIKECDSELVMGFCKKLESHFSSDLVRWLYRHAAYKNGNMDVTRPDVNLSITIDEVLS